MKTVKIDDFTSFTIRVVNSKVSIAIEMPDTAEDAIEPFYEKLTIEPGQAKELALALLEAAKEKL